MKESYPKNRLTEVIQCAYEKSPIIRHKFDQAGVDYRDIVSVETLALAPVLRKEELLQLQAQAPPFGNLFYGSHLKRIFVSPGPLFDPQGGDSLVVEYQAKALSEIGFSSGDIVINTFSYHLAPAGLLLDEALGHLGATVIPAGTGSSELQVQIMQQARATGYVGTPGFLMVLLQRIKEQGLNFRQQFSLRKAVLGGETLSHEVRRELEQDYGIDTYQVYGTADLGIMAHECRNKSGFHVMDNFIVEIVDPDNGEVKAPGEIGEVVITSLSKDYLLLRLAVGDLSSYTDDVCGCGKATRRLLGIVGRCGDAVKVRGMFIHPGQVKEVVSRVSPGFPFQLVVRRSEQRDETVLTLESTPDSDREKLSRNIQQLFPEICRVKLDKVEFCAVGELSQQAKPIVDERKF